MSNVIEVKVPDLGDFKNIPVIEVLVKPGDTINPEDSLITLETDKATMEVPSPAAGVVKELKIKVGDKVSEGSLILMLEASDEGAAKTDVGRQSFAADQPDVGMGMPTYAAAKAPEATEQQSAAVAPATPASRLSPHAQGADIHAEVVVLGAGPGGYTAAFRAADLGKKVVMIEQYPTLGGVCLNVGCIPSKALLHVAKVITEADEMAHAGVAFGKPKVEIDKLRAWKTGVVGRLTKGLAGLAKQRKVQVYKFVTFGMILLTAYIINVASLLLYIVN